MEKGLIFTYVMCYGGSILSLFRPYYGLLIYVGFSILRPEALWEWSFGDGGRGFSRIIAIFLLIGWALNGFGSWKLGRAKALMVLFACFCGWALISAPNARMSTDAAMYQVEEYTKVLLPFIVGLTLIKTLDQIKALAWVIIACEGYLALEANRQYYYDEFVAENWSFLVMDSNSVAITMVAAAGLTVFMALATSRWWAKLICLVLAGLMIHVVLFSLSRGGMLSLCFTALVGFWLIPKRPVHIAIFVGMVLLGLRLAGPMVMDRFGTSFAKERDSSAQSRIDLWGQCIQVMGDHPVLGVGPNNWFLIAPAYGWGSAKAAHSMWLQVGAEMGVPGMTFLILFYFVCLKRLYRYTRERTEVVDPWVRHLARMVIASLVGYALAAQFLSVQGVELPYYIVLIGAGVLKVQALQMSSVPTVAAAPRPVAGSQVAVPVRQYGMYPAPSPYRR